MRSHLDELFRSYVSVFRSDPAACGLLSAAGACAVRAAPADQGAAQPKIPNDDASRI
ncbi:protein of unknown function; putative exported protein [Methylorubrum extorquens DM4]|uniref:Uncharacterized protein n=1 Tax=Methylorubrum extorquens (strain DSM 6343 / CIP 106787 / DM4) TaxID=661410 RepID=C7CDM1_METED|nr:protein of unknown function; putative exported protein [Methylorubrum extorquens DM4]